MATVAAKYIIFLVSRMHKLQHVVSWVIISYSLSHWRRVTHICVSKLTIIGSNNGLSPDRRQAIIWTNPGLLLIGPLQTNFSEILIEILTFSFKKMCLKVLSAKRRPQCVKVAEDDIAFKLAILKKSLHLNDNTCYCSIIQSSTLVLGSLLAKNNFFVQFSTKKYAFSRMANCGSGLPAEWPFRSQNAIEASDSPLAGGLWVKRLITHALCSLAYSDIAWCKLFLIFTMKCLYWVFFAYKTPYSVLIDNSIHIQEIDTEKTWLTLQGQIFRCIKHLSVSQLKYLYIVSVKYFR